MENSLNSIEGEPNLEVNHSNQQEIQISVSQPAHDRQSSSLRIHPSHSTSSGQISLIRTKGFYNMQDKDYFTDYIAEKNYSNLTIQTNIFDEKSKISLNNEQTMNSEFLEPNIVQKSQTFHFNIPKRAQKRGVLKAKFTINLSKPRKTSDKCTKKNQAESETESGKFRMFEDQKEWKESDITTLLARKKTRKTSADFPSNPRPSIADSEDEFFSAHECEEEFAETQPTSTASASTDSSEFTISSSHNAVEEILNTIVHTDTDESSGEEIEPISHNLGSQISLLKNEKRQNQSKEIENVASEDFEIIEAFVDIAKIWQEMKEKTIARRKKLQKFDGINEIELADIFVKLIHKIVGARSDSTSSAFVEEIERLQRKSISEETSNETVSRTTTKSILYKSNESSTFYSVSLASENVENTSFETIPSSATITEKRNMKKSEISEVIKLSAIEEEFNKLHAAYAKLDDEEDIENIDKGLERKSFRNEVAQNRKMSLTLSELKLISDTITSQVTENLRATQRQSLPAEYEYGSYDSRIREIKLDLKNMRSHLRSLEELITVSPSSKEETIVSTTEYSDSAEMDPELIYSHMKNKKAVEKALEKDKN